MKVAITGANGHLGRALYMRLEQMGIETIACARTALPFAVAQAPCDLQDIDSLAQSFSGCKVVFHTAAPTQLWSRNTNEIEKPILQGTLNVIRACARAKVERIIYTSSCAAIGFRARADGLCEDDYNHHSKHPQFRAKLRSEVDGAELAGQLGVAFIRVCAPSIVGPGFNKATPSVEPYVRLVRGTLPLIPDLSYSVVDVRDMAQAQILLSLGSPKHDRYIVHAHYVTTDSLLRLVAQIAPDLKMPWVAPSWTLPSLAVLDAAAYYVTLKRGQRRLTIDLARECRDANQKLNTSRFRNEFQLWSPRSLHESIYDTIAYIRSEHAQ